MSCAIKTCGRCSEQFACGAASPDAACWCAELPRVMELPAEGDCFCPACLRTMIDARLDDANSPSDRLLREQHLPNG